MNALRLPIDVYLIAPTLVCWGLEKLIHAAQPNLILVGTAETLQEAAPGLDRRVPDVLVIDVDDGCTGEELCEFCRSSRMKVIAVTAHQELAYLQQAIMDGLQGIVDKHTVPATLLRAIERVNDGELWLGSQAAERVMMRMAEGGETRSTHGAGARIASLTTRERQTIAALASDAAAPAKVIAGRLCISEHTLRNHLTSIYGKLGVANRVDLYAFATRHSLHRPN
jgi:two-component system nitrate/nitrite response regulator NarL